MTYGKTKKIISLLLSVILTVSSFCICDFSAFAETTVDTTTANFDFSKSFEKGQPPVNNTVGSGNVQFYQYRSSGYSTYNGGNVYHYFNNGSFSEYYTNPMIGCFEEDGILFIDNLTNYIADGKDFEISWKYYIYDKAFSDWYAGYFSIGTGYQQSNAGVARYNLSENNVLSTSYDGKIRKGETVYQNQTFTAATAGVKECSVYYTAKDKTFKIKIGNETKTVSTDYRPSQMNYFCIGSATRSSYAKFIVDHITVRTVEHKPNASEAKTIFQQAKGTYENKMKNGTIYTNMSTAYNAYVSCRKAYDAYVYGGNTNISFNSYIESLYTAIDNMRVWNAPTTDYIPAFSASDSRNSENAKNCIWAETNNDPVSYITGSNNNTTTHFYYHDSVYMYANEAPEIPFILGFYRSNSSATANPANPRVWYVNMTSQTGGLYVKNQLYNGDVISGERDFRNIISKGYRINSTQTTNANQSIILSTGDMRYMANYFSVDYSSAFNNNSSYYVAAKPTSFLLGAGNKSNSTGVTSTHNVDTSGGKTFYIINYKALLDRIYSSTYRGYFDNIWKYSEGGLTRLMAAIDNATKVNPVSYNYAANTQATVQNCANAIGNAVSQFNNVGNINEDSSAYQSLRNAIETANNFNGTNETISNGDSQTTRYTVNSWNRYTTSLATAKAAMANVFTASGYAWSYNSKNISAIASDITDSINSLKYNYIVEYINYAGKSMGSTVCEQDGEVDRSIVINTPIKANEDKAQTHTVYEWPQTTLTKEACGDNTVVQVKETAKEVECTLQEKEVIHQATCTEAEVKLYVCPRCKAEYQVTGEALGHSYTQTVVPATCTQKGYTHHACTRCSEAYDDNYTEMTPHNFVSTVVEPTCTEKGYTSKRCSDCGYEIIDDTSYVNALGHDYTYEVVSSANCTFTGVGEYTCTRCHDSYTVEIPTDSNVHGDMIFSRTVSPSEVEEGYDIYYCSCLCGYWEKRNVVPALGKDNDMASYIDAYNAAKACVVTDFKPYTEKSISQYEKALQEALQAGNQAIENKSVADIENATKAIIEASSILRIKLCDVKVYIFTADGEIREFGGSCNSVEYGNQVSIDIANELNNENVEKWTVESNGVTKKVAYSQTSYDMIARDDAVINVYLTDEEVQPSDSSKVTILNNDGKVISTSYVKNGYVINPNDDELLGIKAPSVPFYQFSGWKIVSGNSTVNSDTVVQATYTVI